MHSTYLLKSNILKQFFLILIFSDLPFAKMPRSNKKKTFLKPLPKPSMTQSGRPPNTAILELMSIERNLMISRAISSGRKHGITLKQGSANPGVGDCAFESVIQNNNNRTCSEKKISIASKLLQKNMGDRYGKQDSGQRLEYSFQTRVACRMAGDAGSWNL